MDSPHYGKSCGKLNDIEFAEIIQAQEQALRGQNGGNIDSDLLRSILLSGFDTEHHVEQESDEALAKAHAESETDYLETDAALADAMEDVDFVADDEAVAIATANEFTKSDEALAQAIAQEHSMSDEILARKLAEQLSQESDERLARALASEQTESDGLLAREMSNDSEWKDEALARQLSDQFAAAMDTETDQDESLARRLQAEEEAKGQGRSNNGVITSRQGSTPRNINPLSLPFSEGNRRNPGHITTLLQDIMNFAGLQERGGSTNHRDPFDQLVRAQRDHRRSSEPVCRECGRLDCGRSQRWSDEDEFDEYDVDSNFPTSSQSRPVILPFASGTRRRDRSHYRDRRGAHANRREDPRQHATPGGNLPRGSFHLPGLVDRSLDGDATYEDLLELDESIDQRGLSPEQMDNIPSVTFKGRKGEGQTAAGGDESDKKCSVCMDDFAENSKLKILPCLHKFHVECIMPWLQKKSECPVCRHDPQKTSAPSAQI